MNLVSTTGERTLRRPRADSLEASPDTSASRVRFSLRRLTALGFGVVFLVALGVALLAVGQWYRPYRGC